MKSTVAILHNDLNVIPYWNVSLWVNGRECAQTDRNFTGHNEARAYAETFAKPIVNYNPYEDTIQPGFNIKGTRAEISTLGGCYAVSYYKFNIYDISKTNYSIKTAQAAREYANSLSSTVVEYLPRPAWPDWLKELPSKHAPITERIAYNRKWTLPQS